MTPSTTAIAETAVADTAASIPQARTPNWTEYVGVAAFFVLCLLLSAKMVQAVRLGSGLWVALAAAAGFVASDFISGVVHWTFDTWGTTTTPVVGKTFINHFRVHHSDPVDICRHGFIATNGHNCLATVPVLFGSLFLNMGSSGSAALLTFLVAICMGTFGTNQFHKWAHQEQVGPLVGFLQRHHLVLNPSHHDRHHTRPYDQHYCITTGWMNPVLRSLRFFRAAEWAITRITGVQPRKNDLETA